ncbi:MAG TPA: hypothetical protein VF173_21645 [Thermoanaerobaculia bacterium]|nr:hypothetical protein [Thermoanaerobaculia bacterium]
MKGEAQCPSSTHEGEIFRSWEGSLNACQAQAAQLPHVEPLRTELQEILDQARQVKAEQEEAEAKRQGLTQQLAELIERGREVDRRLRGYAKSQLGTKNELLVQFGAAPIRHRSRKSEPGTPAPKATP